jgi:7,8-dihydropterin-6-yl-methyl-4-(beta-D-ribofuranosyl)aminobenzene 5'-phosphate synthase
MPARFDVTRRTFVKSAFAVALAAQCGRPAAATSLVAPEVDTLTLQVIVDSSTFGPFLPDESLPGLRVQRGSGRPAPRMSRKALMGEFGLSLLARSQVGAQARSVMVDFGYSPEVIANNLSLLGIDTKELNAAVLSHGHLDHYGGFGGVFGANVPAKHVPLFVGGEETFCERVAMTGTPPAIMGILDRQELALAGLDVKIAADPAIVADHAFTTGLIPLETFERAAIPTQMHPGVGCEKSALSAAKRDSAQLPDDGEHELATCYNVKGLGLVVIASCSHRGVLNSVKRAQAISGVQRCTRSWVDFTSSGRGPKTKRGALWRTSRRSTLTTSCQCTALARCLSPRRCA